MCLQWQRLACSIPGILFLHLTGRSALCGNTWNPRNAWITGNKRRSSESECLHVHNIIFLCFSLPICFCCSMYMQITLQRSLFFMFTSGSIRRKRPSGNARKHGKGVGYISALVQLHQKLICSRVNLLCSGWFSLIKIITLGSCNSGLLLWNLNLSYVWACISHFKILRKSFPLLWWHLSPTYHSEKSVINRKMFKNYKVHFNHCLTLVCQYFCEWEKKSFFPLFSCYDYCRTALLGFCLKACNWSDLVEVYSFHFPWNHRAPCWPQWKCCALGAITLNSERLTHTNPH